MQTFKNQTNSSPPPRDELERLYVVEGLSCQRIAPLFGLSHKTIHQWLIRYGIPTRSPAEARRIAVPVKYEGKSLENKRRSAAEMRARLTPESFAKISASNKGRIAPNKGKPMSEEQRQILIAQRADPEYRRLARERNLGEKSALWKGGSKTEHERHLDSADWRRIRQLVYARDNYTCQECGIATMNFRDSRSNPSRRVQAHHIIPRRYGGGDELENLVTLCAKCHTKRERSADGKLFA